MNLNKVLIAGNITADPEQKVLESGTAVTTFGVAVNRTFKDRDGNNKEETEFANIVVWGKQAESCATYLKKGSGVFVEGRNQTRSWEKDGVKHYRTEIVADRVQFGAKPTENANAQEQKAPEQFPADDIDPADIPF